MEIRLDHCVIHVSERSRSNSFYRDVLGAELVGDPDGVAMYSFANISSTCMGPALDQTRLRGFRCSRAEAICASSGLDQSRARSTTCAPIAWRSSLARCGAAVRAARERACTSATPTAACSNSSRTPEAGSPSTSGLVSGACRCRFRVISIARRSLRDSRPERRGAAWR
jgi:catechol 2,3-dioxygenase-like lactoylglutathione lyase family enzyme